MGGRLLDWLGGGDLVNLPAAASMVWPSGLLGTDNSVALYFANDVGVKKLFVLDQQAIDWFEIDMAAITSLQFRTMPDVDWTTPPTDGQVFIYDLATDKMIPSDFPAGYSDEDTMDAMDAAFSAGTHVGITITYDDVGNVFDFELDDVYVQGLADGQIAAASIADLSDVHSLAGIADGQVLMWSTANSRFEFGTPSTVGSIDDLTDVDTSTTPPAVGDTMVWDGTNWVPSDPFDGAGAGLQKVSARGSDAQVTTADNQFVPKHGSAPNASAASANNLSVSFTLADAQTVTVFFSCTFTRSAANTRFSITDTAGTEVYPIGGVVDAMDGIYALSHAEGNAFSCSFAAEISLAAGTHKLQVKHEYALSANASTFYDRQLIVFYNDSLGVVPTAEAIRALATPADIPYAASITPDVDAGFNFQVGVLTGNITINDIANLVEGDSGFIYLKQDGTGGWTASFGSSWRFPGGAAANPIALGANDVTVISYVYIDGLICGTVAPDFTA
jgi:hypothetical protein